MTFDDLEKAEKTKIEDAPKKPFTLDEVKNHPELSEAGREFFSDYHPEGPFYNYEAALEQGTPPSVEKNPQLHNLTPQDIEWGMKHHLGRAELKEILANHKNLPGKIAEDAFGSPWAKMAVLRNPNLSDEMVQKVLTHNDLDQEDLSGLLGRNELPSPEARETVWTPKQGLSPETITSALNHGNPKTVAAALKSGQVPYEKAKEFFNHRDSDVRRAALTHPELDDSGLMGMIESGEQDLFNNHPRAMEFLQRHPDTYKNSQFDLRQFLRDRLLSPDHIDHVMTHAKGISGESMIGHRSMEQILDNRSLKEDPKALSELVKKHPDVFIDAMNGVESGSAWKPEHTKVLWDKYKDDPKNYQKVYSSLRDEHIFPGLAKQIVEKHLQHGEHGVADPSDIKRSLNELQSAIDVGGDKEGSKEDLVRLMHQMADHSNHDLARGVVDSTSFRDPHTEIRNHPEYKSLVQKLIDHPNDGISSDAVQQVEPDQLEGLMNHLKEHIRLAAGKQLEPKGIYPKDRMVGISFDTGKLRLARDIAEEAGGKIPKKELEKRGFNLDSLGIKKFVSPKGEITSQDIQSHIDGLPKTEYGFNFGQWNGGQQHSREPSKVFQLQMTKDHIKKLQDEGLLDTFRYIEDKSRFSNHPNAQHNALGWVRYTEDKEEQPEPEKPKLMLDKPGHPSHGKTVTIQKDMPHPQTGVPGHAVSFDHPIHMAQAEGGDEQEHPAGTLAWIGKDEIGEGKHWKTPPKVESQEPKKKLGVFTDEIQSDFGQALGRSAEAFARYKMGRHAGDQRIKEFAEEYEKNAPADKREKIANILFGGRHSNEVLHEAFLQHLRDKGKAGSPVSMWQLDPKARISLSGYPETAAPVHFRENYEKLPKAMGYTPSQYSKQNQPTQKNPDHQGKPTWQQTLRKIEELRERLKKASSEG